ncbi:BatD family protein [Candidatus Margulisiibacteriota bacterium]
MVKKVFALLIIACFCSSLLLAEELSVSARVNKTELSINDYVSYEITISGANLNRSTKLELPDLKKIFQVISTSRSTSISIINGKKSIYNKHTYILQPLKTGKLKIMPTTVKFKHKIYKTNPIEITVSETQIKATIPTSTNQIQPQMYEQRNIFLKAYTNKDKIYVGEQILYQADLYLRIDPWQLSLAPPQITDFWVEDLLITDKYSLKKINSMRYYVFPKIKKILYPLKAGEFTIEPVKAAYMINPFGGQKTITSEVINLSISNLPTENIPKNFSGLVGDYSMKVSGNFTEAFAGNPLAIQIIIKGDGGNLKSINALSYPADPSLKIYRSNIEDLENSIRIFEYMLIPKIPGRMQIPEFSLTYFSLQNEAYQKLSTTPHLFTAQNATQNTKEIIDNQLLKQDISLLNHDIRYIKTNIKKYNHKYFYQTTLFFVILFGNLIIISFTILLLCKKYLFIRTPSQLKKEKALQIALKQLNNNIAPAKIHSLFLEFLSNKTTHNFYGLTSEEIKNALKEYNINEALISDILNLLAQLSYSSYAPSMSEIDTNEIITKVALYLKELNKKL